MIIGFVSLLVVTFHQWLSKHRAATCLFISWSGAGGLQCSDPYEVGESRQISSNFDVINQLVYQVRSQDFYVIGTSHQHSANTWKHYISVIHQCTFDLLKTCKYSPSCSAWFVWGGQGKDCACELRQDLGEFVSWWSRGSLRPFEAHFSRSSSHMCLLSRVWNSIQELCNRYRLLPGGRGGYEQRTTGRILRRSNWSRSEYLATVFYVFFFLWETWKAWRNNGSQCLKNTELWPN